MLMRDLSRPLSIPCTDLTPHFSPRPEHKAMQATSRKLNTPWLSGSIRIPCTAYRLTTLVRFPSIRAPRVIDMCTT